jgi:hypothetical protein
MDKVNPMETESTPASLPEQSSKPGLSRRKALQKILVGGGVSAGLSALPARWAKPLVAQVMVPAHAQTSPPPGTTAAPGTTTAPTTTAAATTTPAVTTTPRICENPLILPTRSIECTAGIGASNSATYYVDDSGPCPELIEGNPPSGASAIAMTTRVEVGGLGRDKIEGQFTVDGQGNELAAFCISQFFRCIDVNETGTTTSGATYQVSGQICYTTLGQMRVEGTVTL